MANSIKKFLPEVEGQYRRDVDLFKTAWFGVGGPAEILFKPKNIEDLSRFILEKDQSLPHEMLGLSSNVIIRDRGVKGVVIKLGRNFTSIEINDNIVSLGAANIDSNIAYLLAEQNLSGLEFLVGIPGNIGGAIATNAGCYGSEISDRLISVEAVHRKTGKVCILQKSDFNFTYRNCPLKSEFFFTKAMFELEHGNGSKIKERLNKITSNRSSTQPIKERTGGSTFKNPPNTRAWELIDAAGMRGTKIGGAQISQQHCNFLINTGSATASDIENLGDLMQKKVLEKFNTKLEWEITRIGDK
jgi:UDP-N-acetylmuramate dehydrogenase